MTGIVFPRRDLPGAADNWGRSIEAALKETRFAQDILLRDSQAQNRTFASTLQLLSQQLVAIQSTVDALPITDSAGARTTGLGVTGAWTTLAAVEISTPPGKSSASIMCVGNAGVLDNLTGGVTTSYGRIVISGEIGPEFPASKDAGSSNVMNVISASFAGEIVAGASVSASLQVMGLNGGAFPPLPANFGQISLTCTFR